MIEISGVHTSRAGRPVLTDVTLQAPSGTITGLLGPNGAGKSTLLQVIAGVLRPERGVVRIDGQSCPEIWPRASRVGAFLSAEWIPGSLTADSFLRHQLEMRGEPGRTDELLDRAGLLGVRSRKVRTFSLGMRQRLGLAAALAGEPSVLLLDEPINGVDPEGIAWFRRTLAEFAAKGGTVLISSHHMAELSNFATGIVVLAEGRVLRAGSLAEFTSGASDEVYLECSQPDVVAERLSAEAEIETIVRTGTGLTVSGVVPAVAARLVIGSGADLYHLSRVERTLEESYFAELGLVEG